MNKGHGDGMTAKQAAAIKLAIIGLCVIALLFIFQPFSMTLYSVGAGLVVLGGLSFNLVPLCRAGVPARSVLKAGVVVLVVVAVFALLAIGSAMLYGLYLERQ